MTSTVLSAAAAAIWNLAGTAGRGLGRVGRTVVSRIVLAQRRRAAIRELEALDDRLLKDIGISRSLIPFLVDPGIVGRATWSGSDQAWRHCLASRSASGRPGVPRTTEPGRLIE